MDDSTRAHAEDELRFRALFGDHFGDVWRFARRRCPGAAEADDVAAETFAVAWRRRDDLPCGDDARLWLFGTARLVLANQRRSTERGDRLRSRIEGVMPTLAPAPDPADVIADRHDDRLITALATLTDDDRELLYMRAWDGLAVSDMAALLDVTPNAVSVRLSKARTRLAAALETKDVGAHGQVRHDPAHTEGDAS